MADSCFHYRLGPARRAAVLLFAMFVSYPRLIGRFFFLKRPSTRTIVYVVLSPLLILRNLLSTFFSSYPAPVRLDYAVTLSDNHLAFGRDDDTRANSYASIEDSFKLGGCWTLLLHDGWLVFLPPGSD